jgi:hypothetical protein
VRVPIIGMKDKMLHLIDDELARNNLPSGKIKNFRLALATKPNNVFFLAEIPTRNTDNSFVMSHLRGVEQAKTRWAQLTSQKAEGRETYKVEFPRNEKAFPEPDWPNPKKQSLESLIEAAFTGRIINEEDDAAFLRLIGDVQSLGRATNGISTTSSPSTSNTSSLAATSTLSTATRRRFCVSSPTSSIAIFGTYTPFASGGANSARRHRSTSATTPSSSATAYGPK